MSILKLAWKNILDKPLNLLLSLILFGLGVGLIIILLLINHQVKEQFDKNLAGIDLVIGAKGSPLQMILCSMYHIDNPTGNISVKEAKPFLNPKHPLIKTAVPLSLGDSHKSYRIVGTDHGILALYDGEIDQGVLWQHDLDVTVGSIVAGDLGMKIGDTFSSAHGFNDDPDFLHDHGGGYNVVGILKPSGSVLDQLILTNTASIWAVHAHEGGEEKESAENAKDSADSQDDHSHDDHSNDDHEYEDFNLLDHEEESITSILVQYKNRTNFQALNLARNINENTDLQAASPAIEINRLYSMMGIGLDALNYLAIIIAIVSAFSIFITLLSSLKDRKYELALLRVIGASQGKLFLLIILEGIILAALGFLLGLFLSHFGMEILSKYSQADYKYQMTGRIWLKEEWIVLAVSLVLGFVAALIPALQAYNTDIHKTLSK